MLFEVLGESPRIMVLDFFLLNPHAKLYREDIAVGSDVFGSALDSILADLMVRNIVILNKEGEYYLNIDSLVVRALNNLVESIENDLGTKWRVC